MKLRMWMLDIAREQSPTLDHLMQYAALTQDAGFDALGLYFEHRFAYPSTPWSHGLGCVTPEMIRHLRSEFPSLQLIPFVNLLGHFEGMIYTEEGKQYREELFAGMQACPANADFVRLCEGLIDDTLACFDSEIIHIGGDETWQLGVGAASQARMAELGAAHPDNPDTKALLYGAHFSPLAERVRAAGRRPAVWGDMFVDHPTALDFLPSETLIFDWQYFNGVAESHKRYTERGFEVVGCPAIQTYNAAWMHVRPSEANVREVTHDVVDANLHGVCVTTWECGLFGAYDTLFPALHACGEILRTNPGPLGDESTFLAEYDKVDAGQWAHMMSEDLAACGGTFAPGRIRSSLKVRLLLNANPFLAWLHHGEELSGPIGDAALAVIEKAIFYAPGEAEKGCALFARSAIEFVRICESARLLYKEGKAEAAVGKLAATRQIFDDLAKVAKRTNSRIGGSLADIERCRVAKEHVERVIQRVRHYGDGSLGYLPAFEHLTHHKFVPHDQAAWWLINRWANQ